MQKQDMNPDNTTHPDNPDDQPICYVVCLKGEMDGKWITWFGGLHYETTAEGNTRFWVSLPDHAALYGLLRKIRDSGLGLVSINRLSSKPSPKS